MKNINMSVTSGKMVNFVSGWTLSRSVCVCQKCCVASSHTSSNPQIQEFPAVGAGWLYQPLYPLPGTPVMKHQPWRSVWKGPQLYLLCSHESGDLRISLVPSCARPSGLQWTRGSRGRSHRKYGNVTGVSTNGLLVYLYYCLAIMFCLGLALVLALISFEDWHMLHSLRLMCKPGWLEDNWELLRNY